MGDIKVPLDQSAPDFAQNAANALKAMKNGPAASQSVPLERGNNDPLVVAGDGAVIGKEAEVINDGSYAEGMAQAQASEGV